MESEVAPKAVAYVSTVSDAVMVCSGAGSQAVAAAMASQHIYSLLSTWAVFATAGR